MTRWRSPRSAGSAAAPSPKKNPAPQHPLDDPPMGPQRSEALELPPLDEVPPSEALAHQTEGLLAHRDAARLDRAILEAGVLTAELVERLTPEDEDPRPPVLEVEHVVAHTEPRVAATGAAFVGVDVEGEIGR